MPIIVASDPPVLEPWVAAGDLTGDCAPDCADLDAAVQAASDLLNVLSNWQFGTVTETVRPVRVGGGCGCGTHMGAPYGYEAWRSFAGWQACSCSCEPRIALAAPIVEIASVLVDGVALVAATDWFVYDATWLVFRDGITPPCCQRLDLPSSEPNTWSITYQHGTPVPAGGVVSARLVACELAKAMAGQDCAFTGRVQSITRDGVSAVVLDDQDFLSKGRTGITFVDLWLRSVAPLGQNQGGTIGAPFARGALLRSP